jgi:biopolymer transport protein ExbD
MARERQRREFEPALFEILPMIVVSQLLILCIVVFLQKDILSRAHAVRAATELALPAQEIEDLLTVLIDKNGFVLQGRKLPLKELDRQLTKIGSFSKNTSVVVKCTNDSPHAFLVQLLDICSRAGLKNLSVFSM